MNLDSAQIEKVGEWISQGLQASDIQKRLVEELGLHLTYLDVRLLLDDLKLRPRDKEPVRPSPLNAPSPSSASVPAVASSSDLPAPPPEAGADLPGTGSGDVSVTVDQITRAGAVVSGRVKFSDGQSAEWYLDQTGRLGLAPAQKGYRPSQQDVMAFQVELQNMMARMGF